MNRLLGLTLGALLCIPSLAHGAKTIRFYSSGHVAGLGLWDIGRNPRLGAAVRHFGEPAVRSSEYGGNGCRTFWPRLGLRVLFVNLGGYDACHGQYGRAQSLRIDGDDSRRWRTERGLRIGMRSGRVPLLHPGAERHSHGWWLTQYTSPFGDNSQVPGMVARVSSGRVSSFRAYIGGAGE